RGRSAARHRAAGVGVRRLLARRGDRRAARARRGAAPGRRRRRRCARLRNHATGTRRGAMTDMRAIALGVHVLDVLVRPVEAIPEGQGGALVDEIRMTAAGSAGGTALILAKLGAKVRSGTAIAASTHLHVGGPEFMGGEAAGQILERAREHGVVTSADILAPGDMGLLEWIAPALPQLDYLLPNDEQVLGFTGASDLVAGCRALIERGVGCVAATCGAEGVLVVDAESVERVPAFVIDVVDTTGCGD